jgi:hypothetical protein
MKMKRYIPIGEQLLGSEKLSELKLKAKQFKSTYTDALWVEVKKSLPNGTPAQQALIYGEVR